MAKVERVYNVPLRQEFLKVPKYMRAKKAMTALKQFLSHHMKSDKVLIGMHLNEAVWIHGMRNPPHHVKVNVVKEEDGTVKAELFGHKIEEKAAEAEKKVKETKKEEKKEVKAEKKEVKAETMVKTEEKKIEGKAEEKEVKAVVEEAAEKKMGIVKSEESAKAEKKAAVKKKSSKTIKAESK